MTEVGAINPIDRQIYRELPPRFFAEATPTAFPAPTLIELNRKLLDDYGISSDWFETSDAPGILTGQSFNPKNPPVALAYSGHQFGNWVPLLGDGRALMLGQLSTRARQSIDVQLKGSGATRYSRGGDGRATLGSVLREYLVSEAMAALGIPTSRSLAVLTTGESVRRERRRPGAVLVRAATSHIRVGTFQHAATNLGPDAVKALADHVIGHHFPDVTGRPDVYLELLRVVIARQATLIARWMLVGFIHGVMNTDNMSVVGETIDYGPCALMDEFAAAKVFSSIDRHGRYAWNQQPAIAHWNLTRFAETLLPLIDPRENRAVELAKECLTMFEPQFTSRFFEGLRAKLGLATRSDATDEFSDATLRMLEQQSADFTQFFDRLTKLAAGAPESPLLDIVEARAPLEQWLEQWQALRRADPLDLAQMRAANPMLIARNHRVEQAIDAAESGADYSLFRRLAQALTTPFDVLPANADLLTPPRLDERVQETFCGT